MTNNQPLVSIIIPTYKRPDTLDRAIKSVLNQTYQNIEVIVVDDNSPDSEGRQLTIEKMKEFENNPKVIYIKHEKNKNGSAARNTGARASKGEYVAFLDDDDEFLPGKIESQLKRFGEVPDDYAICYNRFYTQKTEGAKYLSSESREGDQFINALTRELSFCAGSNMLIKKSAFDAVGGFDESFIRSQDKEIVTRLLSKYKIAYCTYPGLIVHVHTNHSNFDPLQITDYYEEKMSSLIKSLPPKQLREYNRGIGRQRFYYSIIAHKYSYAVQLVFKRKIRFLDACSIIFHGLISKYIRK